MRARALRSQNHHHRQSGSQDADRRDAGRGTGRSSVVAGAGSKGSGFTPPVAGALLFVGDFHGTLATARCLGRRGIDVALADAVRLSRTRASKYVRTFHLSPGADDPEALVQWLLTESRGLEGRVLFAANDDLAYRFSQHRDALLERYRLYVPSIQCLRTILDKRLLYEACRRAGVGHPKTWFLRDASDVPTIEPEITGPVLVKPRTHVGLSVGSKGQEVLNGSGLSQVFREFVQSRPYRDDVEIDDGRTVPMVQVFHENAVRNILSVAGFTDGTGRPPLLRASRKVLQRPRRIGVGLCFEGTPVPPPVVESVTRVCEELGYYGLFEIEFIEHDGEYLLADFNPRLYGQLALDDARALPLPFLSYLSAVDDTSRLAAEWTKAASWQPAREHALCDATLLRLVRVMQRVASVSRMRAAEPWREWIARHGPRLVDLTAADDDPWPRAVHTMKLVAECARHPRAFARSLMR